MSPIEILHVAPPHALQQPTQPLRIRRFDKKVNMITHQTIGVNPAPMLLFSPKKTVDIEFVILVTEKNRLAIVPPLDDMVRVSRQCDSR